MKGAPFEKEMAKIASFSSSTPANKQVYKSIRNSKQITNEVDFKLALSSDSETEVIKPNKDHKRLKFDNNDDNDENNNNNDNDNNNDDDADNNLNIAQSSPLLLLNSKATPVDQHVNTSNPSLNSIENADESQESVNNNEETLIEEFSTVNLLNFLANVNII